MKKILFLSIASFACGITLLVTGCATSELVDVWSDPSIQHSSMNRIFVISVSKNTVKRRIWEDAFCNELVKHNVSAMPSYRLFPDAAPDTIQVNQVVDSKKYDGIVVTRRLPTEMKTQYQPGYVTQEQNMRYDRRRDRFVTYYRNVEHYGFIDSQKIDIRLIDVWSTTNDGEMIWSATSKTPEQDSDEEVQSTIAALVMNALADQHLIPVKN